MHPYVPSPKIIIISGPRCSGKSYTGKKLSEEMMFSCISQDHVRLALEKKHGLSSVEMSHPKTKSLYRKEFMKRLREIRYSDIVIEGARLSIPFINQAFLEALRIEYGDYCIVDNFFLLPDVKTRYERYAQRVLMHIEQLNKLINSKSSDTKQIELLMGYITSPFNAFPNIPEGFKIAKHPDEILDWAVTRLHQIHPTYPFEHSSIIEEISKSTNNYSPFYQTVDIAEKRIIEGQTKSYITWNNIKKLGIDFNGKHVCEIGCNNGYFLFRAEEQGAICKGFEISSDSVSAALAIKEYTNSKVKFEVVDVSKGFEGKFDILMALNMLHYIENIENILSAMAQQSNHLILEIGKGQLELIVSTLVKHGHKVKKVQESHRKQSVIGERVILHFVKNIDL